VDALVDLKAVMLNKCVMKTSIAALLLSVITSPVMGQEPPAAPEEQIGEYAINPGDDLQIFVWGEERLQRSVHVLPDGTIAIPLIGQMMARGDTPGDLEAKITEKLRDQYKGEVPKVTVSVMKPAGLQFSVMGKVNSPGVFSPGRSVSIIEALALAGGPAPFANLKDIIVMRKVGTDLQTYHLDARKIFKGRSGNINLKELQALQTGDLILVR
jgi:polysaccharide biosynthesis/export protein